MSVDEVEILRTQVATLTQLLEVHEEQASQQFEIIRAQRERLEQRAHELAKNAEFLQELYRAMPSVLIVCNADGMIVSANDATTMILEYSSAELVGMPVGRILESGDALLVEGFAAMPGVLRTEKTLVSKSGTRVPVLLCAAVSDAEGDRMLVCVGLDIRDRRRLELELRQAQKLESIGRLAAGVAHEINTPIQFVSDSVAFVQESIGALFEASADVIARADADSDLRYLVDNLPKALERSLDGLARVSEIVRSMKQFAHPDSKQKAGVDLNRAIASTLVIACNEYKLVADVETDFGELPMVQCYLGDLNQAILNIIVNASHAIADRVRESGKRGQIRIATRAHGDEVVISIGDTGGGIPETVRDHIFDPFFTTKEVGRGTGQGLSIARQVVVDRHGGLLGFETELGIGTTFTIRLPAPSAKAA